MKHQKWEYKIDRLVITADSLNDHGEKGWELVNFTPGTGGFPGTAVFKRPIHEPRK